MASSELDVLVIGAGAAGLTALAELDRAGLSVSCVEARNRIGGRILTVRDSFSQIPLELGAEFIHGRPPEIWQLIRSSNLAAYDCGEKAVYTKSGKIQEDQPWELVKDVMDDMQKAAAESEDQPFSKFLG